MKDIGNVVQGLKPTLLMVVVQIAFTGLYVLLKLAADDGMSLRVVTAYRNVFATAFIAPLALIIERKKRTKMNWTVLFQSFLCGLFGYAVFEANKNKLSSWKQKSHSFGGISALLNRGASQNFYLEALALTSVTFATAMSNLAPAITLIIAASFRLEKINLKTTAGKAKIVGTITGIGGAMILTLVKGKEIKIGSFHVNILHHQNGTHPHASTSDNLLGALCSLAYCTSYALWLIVQKKMTKRYQSHYTSTVLMSFWASVLSIVFALCIKRDWSQWRLGWNIRLLTVAYGGTVISGLVVVVMSWCVQMRGPFFVSVFNPLPLVVLAFAGSTILNEKLYLGSIIGSLLIVCGLYAVIWGKSKEIMEISTLVSSNESDTVKIVLRGTGSEEISNSNGRQVIRDDEDSSADGHEEKSTHVHNQGKE